MLTITCKECGHVLYEGIDLKSPEDIARQNGSICPKCQAPLDGQPTEIRINTQEELIA